MSITVNGPAAEALRVEAEESQCREKRPRVSVVRYAARHSHSTLSLRPRLSGLFLGGARFAGSLKYEDATVGRKLRS